MQKALHSKQRLRPDLSSPATDLELASEEPVDASELEPAKAMTVLALSSAGAVVGYTGFFVNGGDQPQLMADDGGDLIPDSVDRCRDIRQGAHIWGIGEYIAAVHDNVGHDGDYAGCGSGQSVDN
jgi:hypothetical protein